MSTSRLDDAEMGLLAAEEIATDSDDEMILSIPPGRGSEAAAIEGSNSWTYMGSFSCFPSTDEGASQVPADQEQAAWSKTSLRQRLSRMGGTAGSIADGNGLQTTTAADAGASSPQRGSEDKPQATGEVPLRVMKSILSKVMEPCRFSPLLTSDFLNRGVTWEALAELIKHSPVDWLVSVKSLPKSSTKETATSHAGGAVGEDLEEKTPEKEDGETDSNHSDLDMMSDEEDEGGDEGNAVAPRQERNQPELAESLMRNTESKAEGQQGSRKNVNSSHCDQREIILQQLKELFLFVSSKEDLAAEWTIRDMFNYWLPDYAITTAAVRNNLRDLATKQEVVTVEDVRETLTVDQNFISCTSKDNVVTAEEVDITADSPPTAASFVQPLLQCIFGPSQSIASPTLVEIVDALELQPNRPTFITEYTKELTSSQRNLALFFPTMLAFLLAAGLIIVNFTLDGPYRTLYNLKFPLVDEWQNGCSVGGPTGNECLFTNRNIQTMQTLADARHFLTTELVLKLWSWSANNGSRAASDAPFGGVWLLGALLLRSSPSTLYTPPRNPDHPLIPCTMLNLTGTFGEPLIPEDFTCQAWTATVIPFSLSLTEALEQAKSFNPVRLHVDTVWTANFGAVSPSTGLLLWSTAAVTVPLAGDLLSRTSVRAIDLRTKTKLLPLLLVQIVVVAINMLTLVYSARVAKRGPKFVLTHRTLLIELPLLCLLLAAFVKFTQLPDVDDLAQFDHISKGFDSLAGTYGDGVTYLGEWILLWVLSMTRFFKDINGVAVIFRLLRVVLGEVLGLFFVFGVIYFGFLTAAMALFGSTQYQFSTAMLANSELLPFWWGKQSDAAYEFFTQENPTVGAVYYYVYKLFIVFFALNLLVAVVTSPLGSVRKAATLHVEHLKNVSRSLSKESRVLQWTFSARAFFLPFVLFITDALMVLPQTACWTRNHYLLEKVYGYKRKPRLKDRLTHGLKLLKFIEVANDPTRCPPWDSPLWNGVAKFDVIKDDIEREVLKACIMRSTYSNLLRDARLLHLLLALGQHTAKVDETMQIMESTREQTAKKDEELRRKVAQQVLNNNTKSEGKSRKGSLEVGSPRVLGTPPMVGASPAAFNATSVTRPTRRGCSEPLRVSQLKFAFSQYFMRRLDSRKTFPLYLILIAVAYVSMMSFLVLNTQDASGVTVNAMAGLVEQAYSTNCDDPECIFAFTQKKTFANQGHLPDFFQYIHRVIRPYLFPTFRMMTQAWGLPSLRPPSGANRTDLLPTAMSPNLTSPSSNSWDFSNAWNTMNFTIGADGYPQFDSSTENRPLYWDPKLSRLGPITVRQLRAKQIPCALEGRTGWFYHAASDETYRHINSFPCFGTGDPDDLSDAPMQRPVDSLYPTSAYIWKEGCAQPGGATMAGWFHRYACAGYTINISTVDELDYLSSWIDNTTRFISISVTFEVEGEGEEFIQTLHLLWEIASEGGAAWMWTRAYSQGKQKLSALNFCAYSVMALEVLIFFFGIVRYIYFRRKGNLYKAEHSKPETPVSVFLAGAAMFASSQLGSSQFASDTFVLCSCIAFLTVRFLLSVAFPIADLGTRGATLIKRILWLTMSTVTIVLPFYVIAFVALVLSGNVLFGGMLSFANLKLASITIGKGIVGEWNFEQFGQFNSTTTGLVFNCVFVLVMSILLANIVLSLVNGAAEEARGEEAALEFIAITSAAMNKRIVSGPLFQCFLSNLAGHSTLFRRLFPKKLLKPSPQPFTITPRGRFPLPWEILHWLPEFGSLPNLHTEILSALDAYQLPGWVAQSTVMLIAKEMREFEVKFADRVIDDEGLDFQYRLEAMKERSVG